MIKKEEQEQKNRTAQMWAARRARWNAWKQANPAQAEKRKQLKKLGL
jgi:hypothetical protein